MDWRKIAGDLFTDIKKQTIYPDEEKAVEYLQNIRGILHDYAILFYRLPNETLTKEGGVMDKSQAQKLADAINKAADVLEDGEVAPAEFLKMSNAVTTMLEAGGWKLVKNRYSVEAN